MQQFCPIYRLELDLKLILVLFLFPPPLQLLSPLRLYPHLVKTAVSAERIKVKLQKTRCASVGEFTWFVLLLEPGTTPVLFGVVFPD